MKILAQGQPLEIASKALILLHGRGGTAEDILTLAPELVDSSFYAVAPEAPRNSWYPFSFLEDEQVNEPSLSQSVETIKNLIDQIAQTLPLNKIYIAGFSQGACLALETCAQFATRYGGVIAFTGGLIGRNLNPHKYHGDFAKTPVFIGTSDNDPHVPLTRAEETKSLMEKMGAEVTLKVYPGMGHTINVDEILHVKTILVA